MSSSTLMPPPSPHRSCPLEVLARTCPIGSSSPHRRRRAGHRPLIMCWEPHRLGRSPTSSVGRARPHWTRRRPRDPLTVRWLCPRSWQMLVVPRRLPPPPPPQSTLDHGEEGWQMVARHKQRRRAPRQPPPPHRPIPATLVGRYFNCMQIDHVITDCANAACYLRCHRVGNQARACKRPRSPELPVSPLLASHSTRCQLRSSTREMGMSPWPCRGSAC
jgi:hypothetical protein